MKPNMRRFRSKCYKIFYSVVFSVTINVVNNIRRIKKSFDLFFDNNTMFKNIVSNIFKWMVRRMKPDISQRMYATTYKIRRLTSFLKFSFRRTMFSLVKYFQFSTLFLTGRTFLMSLTKFLLMFFRPFNAFVPRRLTFFSFTYFLFRQIIGFVKFAKARIGTILITSCYNFFPTKTRSYHISPLFGCLLILTLTSLMSTNTFAQGCTKNCIFEYDDMSGGLNSKLSPYSLPKQQGDIVENLRFDDQLNSLTKRDSTVVACSVDNAGPVTGLHRFYMKDGTKITMSMHGNKIVTCNDSTGVATDILSVSSSDQKWDCLTWHDLAICTDGVNQPIKYDGSSTSATYLGSALATDAGEGAGPDGTYTYKVLCYSTTYKHILDQASNPVTVVDNDIDLTMIPICPDTITGESTIGRMIYRSENTGAGTYKLVSDVGDSLGTIPNNTAVTTTDSDADGALGAAYPSGDETVTPPKGRYIALHKNRLWLGNNQTYPSRLYYGEDSSHDYFSSTEYMNIRPNDGDEITFVKNVLGVLTVAKNNTIQKIDTRLDDPSADWAISDPFSFVGCQAPYSAINTDQGIMYLGNNGIYVFTGQYSQLISDAVTPEIRDIQPSNFPNVWSAYYKNSYYMAYTSIATGASVNDKILVVDLIDKSFSIDTFGVNVFHVFSSGTDVEALYSGGSGDGNVYAHTETVKGILHNQHSDFTGTFDDMRYIPTTAGGDADDPVFDLSWTATLDSVTDANWVGTIDGISTSIIDRPDFDGNYTSQYLTVEATTFDKLYWNESLPIDGGDITFDMRTGSSTTDTATASWTLGFSNSAGSDISNVTGDTIMQYRVNMTTDTITQTPLLVKESNYVVWVTYNIAGTTNETGIPIRWRSGWLDYGYPGYVKELRKVYVYYDWNENTSGTLTLTFTGRGAGLPQAITETDTFTIDLLEYPDYYIEYFPDGNLIGELIRLEISETSLNPIKIQKIIVVYDVQGDLT